MLEFFFIRHGKTYGNTLGRYIGTTDEPLCREGRECLTGGTYPQVETVYVSPMKRCLETAAILYPGLTPKVIDQLRECDFGMFENKNYEELKDHPDYQRWLDSGGKIPFPEGEGMDAFCERCVKGFCNMTGRFIEEGCRTAAFVVHGGTIMAVLDRFAHHEEGFYHWQVKNGEGFRVKLDEEQWRRGVRRLTEIERL